MAREVAAVATVLRSSKWNMTCTRGCAHERLEFDFANYVGSAHAIAVNTGGMALQMSMRALGLIPGSEVMHQIDTCSATAQAVIAAGCTPMFADIDQRTLMLDIDDVERGISLDTKALIATHMWGNPEKMQSLCSMAERHGIPVIEDTCLSLGTMLEGRMAGTFGDVGVFSFGCLKPIQGGEGGMIVTNDNDLAQELRSMRHWGDRTIEYGVRDTLMPCWNGRMSEIVAAVVTEQLKGYPNHLQEIRSNVNEFSAFVGSVGGIELVLGDASSIDQCAFTQVVLSVDEQELGSTKQEFRNALLARGVSVWHANFELINSLSLFRENIWRRWLPLCDLERTAANYQRSYLNARRLWDHTGVGIGKTNFQSKQNLRYLMRQIEAVLSKKEK